MSNQKPLVIEIRKAVREAARLVIALAGLSGGGKTRTAIELAYGMANYDITKVGFLDAENKRGSLYADCLRDHPTHPTEETFWIGDLQPPFSPDRYSAAIKQFEAAGVEILIIDSASHEWEGEGGAQDIAENNKSKGGKLNWAKAKGEHKKFINTLLQSNMHIIVCTRAREKTREYKDESDGKNKIESLGIQPIQEKNFMFEMTASLMLFSEGKARQVMKCPGELQDALAHQREYVTAADGLAIRRWVEGGGKIDQRTEALRNKLVQQTEAGVENLKEKWGMLTEVQQKAVGEQFYNTLMASAAEYDKQRAESETTQMGGEAAENLRKELAEE